MVSRIADRDAGVTGLARERNSILFIAVRILERTFQG
jgi:hypothetical protein